MTSAVCGEQKLLSSADWSESPTNVVRSTRTVSDAHRVCCPVPTAPNRPRTSCDRRAPCRTRTVSVVQRRLVRIAHERRAIDAHRVGRARDAAINPAAERARERLDAAVLEHQVTHAVQLERVVEALERDVLHDGALAAVQPQRGVAAALRVAEYGTRGRVAHGAAPNYDADAQLPVAVEVVRSEENTSELQSRL